ncbi:MAG: dihydroorotase [Desulfatirhabdiaceae bacterium]
MWTLIKGGRIIDPGHLDGEMDILIQDDRICRILPCGTDMNGMIPSDACVNTIAADGLIVVPGLIDMHVHLREPGHEYKETISSGCLAAAAGGFTALCAMPNTRPVNDNSQVTDFILSRAAKANGVHVYPAGAISKGLNGHELAEYADMKSAGIVAVTDDGRPVKNSLLMRRAMEYAGGLGLLVISHSEDDNLMANGCMNEGPVSTRMGLAGIPNAAESIMVMRDIALCELTRSPLHIAHVSTEESVRSIRLAKAAGIPVTCETAPHYFTLTDEAVGEYDTHAKMNPPLRSAKDRSAILDGLADGTIDVIATDHAPHSSVEKEVEFDQAAFGVIGLETSLPLGLELVRKGILSFPELIARMSINPARILGIQSGILEGRSADLTLIDPLLRFTVDSSSLFSLSRNTPFDQWNMTGRAVLTMVAGKTIFSLSSRG